MLDPLSEVLRSLRLTGGVFLDVHCTAPWCVLSELTADDCRPFLAKPAQLICYHVVLQGSLLIEIDGEPSMSVVAGEIVLLPRNDVHKVASALGLQPVPAHSLVQPSLVGGLGRVVHGGAGDLTHLVCGFLGTEDDHSPLLAVLPRLLKLDLRQGTTRDWVEASVRFAASELAEGRLASSSVMSRLSEVLLVEAVRHYAATLGDRDTGWIKGLGDPQVGRAMALMHDGISVAWTAEALARAVAMSRSAFTERFTNLVGMPPIRYLTMWRLQSARLQLRETARSVGQIAHAVGYESEEAVSRAFQREVGASPARWRSEHQPA